MEDPLTGRTPRRRGWKLLEIDSWVDSQLYESYRALVGAYDAFSAWMQRFHVSGLRRVAIELTSDAATFSIVGGIIVLAFAYPAFEHTDENWQQSTQYSVTFTDRYGRVIGRRGVLHNDTVPLEEIPDHVVKAVLATEDRRFFEHIGIDIVGLFRAMNENVRANDVVQGGSTLTQQLAKNLFLTPERTFDRKIKEAFLALWLEARLSKREILKLYLDRAYLGGGTVGVDAAAEYYFGKSVRDLTVAEAAMMAGLFKAPSRFAPHINLPAARARANIVLNNMVLAGFITEGQAYGARANPATVIDRSEHYVPNYFLDWAFREVQRLARGRDFVLTVKTTADMGIQKAADAAVEASLRQHGQAYGASQGAMVVMDNDGAVRAMVGGRDYGESQFNRAVDALRQPGSSFKPFTYLAAMRHGYTPDYVIVDAPISIGNWSPRNYGRSYAGRVTLTMALARSINTVPVRLSQSFGRDKVAEAAQLVGIRSPIVVTRALPLGVAEVTVLDMAGAYATFANDGRKATGYSVLEIRNSAGDLLYDRDRDEPPAEQVIEPRHAEDINFMLSHVPEVGTGRRAQLEFTVAAGKTGTTQAYRDAWYIGYTGRYTASVWFGNDNFTPTRRMTGGSLPAMTWKQVMSVIHTEQDILPIPGAADLRGIMRARAIAQGEAAAGERTPVAHSGSTLSEPLLHELDGLEALFKRAAQAAARTGRTSARDGGLSAAAGGGVLAPAPAVR